MSEHEHNYVQVHGVICDGGGSELRSTGISVLSGLPMTGWPSVRRAPAEQGIYLYCTKCLHVVKLNLDEITEKDNYWNNVR